MKTAKLTTTTSTTRGRKYKRYVVTYSDEHGSRKRKTFSDKTDAEKFKARADKDIKTRQEREKVVRRKIGQDADKLTSDKLRDAIDALAILNGRGSLLEAAKLYVSEWRRQQKDVPVIDTLTKRYLDSSKGAGLRPSTIHELQTRLRKFAQSFGQQRADEITATDIQKWLDGMKTDSGASLSANSKKHYRYALSGMFNFAIDRDLLSENPAARKTRSRRGTDTRYDDYTCQILSLNQTRRLLAAARDTVPNMLIPVTLGLFAGLRTAEIRRLSWDNIDMARGIIKITAAIAKKRSVRNVTIPANLLKWLMLEGDRTGPVAPQTEGAWRYHHDKLKTEAALQDWPHNALRHSFGSYHVEATGDPGKTAWEMGHRDAGDLLFEHYRQLTTKEDAAEYWKITPENVDSITNFRKPQAATQKTA